MNKYLLAIYIVFVCFSAACYALYVWDKRLKERKQIALERQFEDKRKYNGFDLFI
jgi:hypothetical protein